MTHQQIEQSRQFPRCGLAGIGLLRSGQQVQALLGRSHQAIEEGNVQAMQVLQRIYHAELRP